MYMRRVVLLLVFVRLCFAAQAQEVEKSWRTAVENYNYQEAVELLDQEILQQQDSAKLRSLLLQKASCQKSLYKFPEAIETLTDVIRISGEDPVAFASLAECHRLNGNNIAAMIFYSLAVQKAPENTYFRIQKAMLHYRMEDYSACLAESREIISKDSIHSIITLMGDCFNKLQMADSSLWYYDWAYSRNPADYRTLEKLSGIHLGRKDFDTVARMTSAYLKVDSANVTIAPILGVALHGMGKYDESSEVFKWALELGCDKLSGYYYLGLNDMMKDDCFYAYDWFRKAAELDTADVNLVYYMGYCRAKTLHVPTAEKLFGKVEQMLEPDPAMLFKVNLSRAEMYMQKQMYSDAVRCYLKAESYAPFIPAQVARLGYAYRLTKDYSKAVECYERYLAQGKEGSTTWKFVQAELEFIREEQFMSGE